MIRRYLIVVLTSVLSAMVAVPALGWGEAGASEELPADGVVFLSDSHVANLKARVNRQVEPTYSAYLRLKESADEHLGRRPNPPRRYYVPRFYEDPEGQRAAREAIANDANGAYELALVYRVTNDERYAEAAARNINAWATEVESLDKSADSTLSFSYHFPAMIFAADLIADSPAWPEREQQAFKRFVREKALPMNTMGRPNNWGNWGLVLVISSATYLGDDELFRQAVERWKFFIGDQIAGDGHLPYEVYRNNGTGSHGIWYTHFSLEPQTIAAEIANNNGVYLYDYKSPSGSTLREAFELDAYWTRYPERFPYSKLDPDDMTNVRHLDYLVEEQGVYMSAVSYFEILNNRWPDENATALLDEMRPLDSLRVIPDITFTHGDLVCLRSRDCKPLPTSRKGEAADPATRRSEGRPGVYGTAPASVGQSRDGTGEKMEGQRE